MTVTWWFLLPVFIFVIASRRRGWRRGWGWGDRPDWGSMEPSNSDLGARETLLRQREAQIDQLESRVAELESRLDYTERLLTQRRDPAHLPLDSEKD